MNFTGYQDHSLDLKVLQKIKENHLITVAHQRHKQSDVPLPVWEYLAARDNTDSKPQAIPDTVHNYVIGNNEVALNAAAELARDLGYQVHSLGSDNQGEARIVGRELAVTGLRGIASSHGHVVAATWPGKIKTLAQNCATVALLFHYETLGLSAHNVGMTLLAFATALTLWSGYTYFYDYFSGARSA